MTGTTSDRQRRRPPGTPLGGQFPETHRDEFTGELVEVSPSVSVPGAGRPFSVRPPSMIPKTWHTDDEVYLPDSDSVATVAVAGVPFVRIVSEDGSERTILRVEVSDYDNSPGAQQARIDDATERFEASSAARLSAAAAFVTAELERECLEALIVGMDGFGNPEILDTDLNPLSPNLTSTTVQAMKALGSAGYFEENVPVPVGQLRNLGQR